MSAAVARIPTRFVLHQLPVIRGMGALLFGGRRQRSVPDEDRELVRVIDARPDALVDAYAQHVGAAEGAYATALPPHLFPQWAFALSGELLAGLPYPMHKAVNGGCRLEVRAPLPRGRPLTLRARVSDIDDDGRRAILTQRFVTGVDAGDDALIADVRIFVPLARGSRKGAGAGRDKPRASEASVEVGRFRAGRGAGLDFAKLTGDFNPIHWIAPLARASGFRSVILHGFGTMARTWEILDRTQGGLRMLDVRFTKPLVLPGEAIVRVEGERVWVTPPEGGDAFLEGTFESSSSRSSTRV